jgi:hypothetical protein
MLSHDFILSGLKEKERWVKIYYDFSSLNILVYIYLNVFLKTNKIIKRKQKSLFAHLNK